VAGVQGVGVLGAQDPQVVVEKSLDVGAAEIPG
jgi:hypothetical protein